MKSILRRFCDMLHTFGVLGVGGGFAFFSTELCTPPACRGDVDNRKYFRILVITSDRR